MSLFNYTKETDDGIIQNTSKIIIHSLIGAVLAIIGLILIFGSWTIVKAGERGIVIRLGEVNRVLEPGFHFKQPFIESVINLEVRTQKVEIEATAPSQDLQIVTTNVALNYNIEPSTIDELYEKIGLKFKSRIIDPAIQDSVKAATAKFNAEELITSRQSVKDEIKKSLKERLGINYIVVTDLSIVNFQFSEEFDKAIEEKVTAEQKALEAENKLKQVEFEAQQLIVTSKAQAEAIKIQAQAITQQGGKDYVQLRAIEKWNGMLPQQFVPGSAIPFLNIN